MNRQLISNTEVLAEMLQDPAVQGGVGQRTAGGGGRGGDPRPGERGLSQTALARLLGWRQPVVARLEAAEHNPTMVHPAQPSP